MSLLILFAHEGFPMAMKETLKARWFWYSIICMVCWGGWALLSKFGSRESPAEPMQFLFTLGSVPVAIALLIIRRFRLEKSGKGIAYGLLNGLLSGVGGLALFGAYHTNGNTSVITAASALYPMITVLLAVTFLHEKLGATQIVGLGFAAAAIVIFSI